MNATCILFHNAWHKVVYDMTLGVQLESYDADSKIRQIK